MGACLSKSICFRCKGGGAFRIGKQEELKSIKLTRIGEDKLSSSAETI
jgi:hypothetical protein